MAGSIYIYGRTPALQGFRKYLIVLDPMFCLNYQEYGTYYHFVLGLTICKILVLGTYQLCQFGKYN